MDISSPALPRQEAAVPDVSGCTMTTFAVHDTSCRGCPSSLAGTTCRGDTSRTSPCAHPSTIRCRTDWSGRYRRYRRFVTHLRPLRLSATVPSDGSLTRSNRTQQAVATGACSNSPIKPFPILPIEDKRALPSLAVSAPNSSQNDILLQSTNPGDLPRRRKPSQDSPASGAPVGLTYHSFPRSRATYRQIPCT